MERVFLEKKIKKRKKPDFVQIHKIDNIKFVNFTYLPYRQ